MIRKLFGPVLALCLVVAVSAAPQNPPAQNPPSGAPARRGAPPPQGRGFGRGLTVWAPVTVEPEQIDEAMNAKIRTEGMEHSKIMWIEHYLADVYGPRPTGSPNQVAAANWAVKTMTSWGMQNAHLEPFTWHGIGWLPGRASGSITSPVVQNLKFESIPWSPSTNGTVKGEVVLIDPPENPTQVELTAYLTKLAPTVKGGIVMVGMPADVPVNFNEPEKRLSDDQVKARYLPPDPNAPARGGRGGRGGFGRGRGAGTPPEPGHLSAQEVNTQVSDFVRDNRPALRLTENGDPRRIPGVIVAQNGRGQTYEENTQPGPGIILRNDDYGRIARIIADGTPVTVEVTMENHFYPQGSTSYVTVAEIPGTDKADEVVMLGGHLDSWASATGATDNAIGSAVMMEAARILEAVGAKPHRTIRVALWSGEEQGLLGSKAYVATHFGSAEKPVEPAFSKLDAYWNIDDGTGLVRGATVFGPPQDGVILAQFLKPFEDWGVYGAISTTSRAEGGSDYGAFNDAGLPGINTQQDPIEYNSTTWHTDLDTYERIVPDDVMKNAVITASVIWGLANRGALLPRFPADEMPERPAGRGGFRGRGGGNGLTAQPRVFIVARGRPISVAAPGLAGGGGAEPTTAALASGPAHGTATVKPDGSFVYTPAGGFTGVDSFTFTITQGATTSEPAAVTLIVK
jgi:carboxypeptidase Q